MFVVCGEALMDAFATGDTTAGVALDARVGGSPFNVAVCHAAVQRSRLRNRPGTCRAATAAGPPR